MADDFLDRLEEAIRKARATPQPIKKKIRYLPRPRPELTDALLRFRGMVSYYVPELTAVTVTNLYEYAARRLLRDSIRRPEDIAADFTHYRNNYPDWWEAWRNK